MINQTLVRLLYESLQIMLQLYLQDTLPSDKPNYYQVSYINTLIHNVTHTYHPEITEQVPQTNYALQSNDNTVPSHQFSLHQLYMTDPTSSLITSSIYNVQSTSHTSKPRTFPSIPYTTENPKFINKYNFQYSELSHTENVTLCNSIYIYRDKLNAVLKELEKSNIIKQIGSSPQDNGVYGTTYFNPFIIISKGDNIKCVLDVRHLNSNTEQSDESWPSEPLAPQLARANKKYKCAIDLMYAYAHTPLDEETIKLTSFSSGDQVFVFIRSF